MELLSDMFDNYGDKVRRLKWDNIICFFEILR